MALAPPHAMVTLPRRVGVLIPAHNCADTLAIAVHCVKAQTVKPARILIVDDGSTDATRAIAKSIDGVEYHWIDQGHGDRACFAKRAGFAMLAEDCPYVLAIDSDGDYVPPDYLERLLDAIEGDYRAAVAYPRVQQFEEQHALIDRQWDRDWLSRENFIPSTSLVRSDALAQIGGWPCVDIRAHDDWACWRRLVAHGWRGVQGDTTYFWRRHRASSSFRLRGRDTAKDPSVKPGGKFNWGQTVDPYNLVTIACPFSGRRDTLDALERAIEAQTFPREQLAILLYDNSREPHFSRLLRMFAAQLVGYADVRVVTDRTPCVEGMGNREAADLMLDDKGRRPNAKEINHRVAGAWNRIGQIVSTDLVWAIEEDVIPPADCLERLLASMKPDVAGVTGAYRSRFNENYVAWRWTSLDPAWPEHIARVGGVEEIGGCGMGCVLVRRQVLQAGPARSAGDNKLGREWYDHNLWADVARRHQVEGRHRLLIDWDVVADHRNRAEASAYV